MFANLKEQFLALKSGVNIDPSVLYDQRSAFTVRTSPAIDQPVIEAAITLEGTDVKVSQGRVGRTVDILPH